MEKKIDVNNLLSLTRKANNLREIILKVNKKNKEDKVKSTRELLSMAKETPISSAQMRYLRNRLNKEVDKKTEKFLELYQYAEDKSDAINSLTDLEDFVMGVLDKNVGGDARLLVDLEIIIKSINKIKG